MQNNNNTIMKNSNNTITQHNSITQNNIVVVPWDSKERITVPVEQIAAAFAENAKLREYAGFDTGRITDPDLAPAYITELFVDLVKRAHSRPESRNVYLNPKQADQVLVYMKSGRWEVVPLPTATHLLFDGVAQTIHRVTMADEERQQLSLDTQNAISVAGLMYADEPDEYTKRAKQSMAAHLANIAAAKHQEQSVGIFG